MKLQYLTLKSIPTSKPVIMSRIGILSIVTIVNINFINDDTGKRLMVTLDDGRCIDYLDSQEQVWFYSISDLETFVNENFRIKHADIQAASIITRNESIVKSADSTSEPTEPTEPTETIQIKPIVIPST